ncbi:polymorphic toxin type 35 domain-containing protein [Butyrivibrio sp. MC2021]|uniref:polymorphic toxin type 35 domain-containing protein n=1 Tax=Butyrivibrio sp. MC2021 TaxID=1408306 RepID=UPI0018CC518D
MSHARKSGVSDHTINHIIEGSVGKDHKWYLLSPTKDWNVIKQIMTNVLRIGQESVWKIDNSGTTYIKTANIQ